MKMTQLIILKEEVENAIARMKNNKSPGIDELTSQMIKAGRDCLIDHLRRLCNLIWKEGKMPKECTKSAPVTISKKGNAQAAFRVSNELGE